MAKTVKRVIAVTDSLNLIKRNLESYVYQCAESFVLNDTSPKSFFGINIVPGSVSVSNRHPDGTDYIYTNIAKTYTEDIDYVIDYENGTIVRIAGSTIPDWSVKPVPTKVSYGDETKNNEYLIWVTYKYYGNRYYATKTSSLPRLLSKINSGNSLNITILGDSISTGSEAEKYSHRYFNRFATNIIKKSNVTNVNVINKAVGGESTYALTEENLTTRVTGNPDLIIIAYGMNDQNSISGDVFEINIRNAINWIKLNFPDADIILISSCIANYDTFYTVNDKTRFNEYLLRLNEISDDTDNVWLADVNTRWEKYLQRKTYHDLLRNDINHPTSFGHTAIYPEVLESVIPY